MSEHSLDGLVKQFAVVLTAMTESESLLLDRVRSARLGAQLHSVADASAPSAAPFPTGSVMSQPAPTSDGEVRNAQESEKAPAWTSAPSPKSRPESPEVAAGSPETAHRDYDYFSELDEKLSGLRQRYLE
jgi:hypothetical protein